MAENINIYTAKLKLLLGKFSDVNYQIKNDIYLNRLLTHLSGKQTTGTDFESLTNSPIFPEWLAEVVTLWDATGSSPSPPIASFTLNLTALISRIESKFNCLNRNNFFVKLIKVTKAKNADCVPSVKLAYIKLMASFLEHQSGIEWTTASNQWENVLQLSLAHQTVYITREGTQFISKLLKSSAEFDEGFCDAVVRKIMIPVIAANLQAINSVDDILEINEEAVHKNLSPTLILIGAVLEYFLENSVISRKDFKIVLIFFRNANLEQCVFNYLMIVQNKLLILDLGRIMLILIFIEVYSNVLANNTRESDFGGIISKIVAIFNANISKGNFENVMKFCYLGHFYESLIISKIPFLAIYKFDQPFTFGGQFIVLQLLPQFCVSHKFQTITNLENDADEFRSEYVRKIFKTMCPNTIRIGYNWRNYLMNQENLFEVATKSVLYVLQSRKYYSRDIATTVFQCLVYSLKDILTIIKNMPEHLGLFQREFQYVALLLEGICVFIEDFKITWRDSVETICIMALSFDLLSIPTWPAKMVVKALKLINISIAKYMTPNMALLVDKTSDSTIALICPLLYAKLHDGAWEVRDTALEVVCTMSSISHRNFPSLQKVLLESELPDLIVKMATGDGEAYVRASAIKCLQEMTKVEDFWETVLKNRELPQKMSSLLRNETEGVVRMEAAYLMCVLYENQTIEGDLLDHVYDSMVHCVTRDLHWEVKVRGLDFWDKVIRTLLTNQGMIDGAFPNVTFSRDNRKIVNLTELEIRKRLQKVLIQLSSIGCLGVLCSAIQDDCDIEVTRMAVKITTKFMQLLRNYNVTIDGANWSLPSSPGTSDTGFQSRSPDMDDGSNIVVHIPPTNGRSSPPLANRDFSDNIIAQIISANDMALLGNVYSPSDSAVMENFVLPARRVVTPAEFLNLAGQDLENLIANKSNWLSGIEDLSSLLDDMLKSYDDNVNNMDCY